jgi:membrane protein DedA with SNARE-associated domain
MDAVIDVRAVADAVGYPAAALGILVESTGIPFPGELALLAVAAYAAAGGLDIRLVVVCAALGATGGADAGYAIGYFGGRPFVERFGRVLHVNMSHLASAEMFFARHGDRAVLLGRFVLGFRTWGSALAGVSRMPFWRFQVFSAAGSAAWAAFFGWLGYVLGDHRALLEAAARYAGYTGLVALVGAGVIYYLARRRAART